MSYGSDMKTLSKNRKIIDLLNRIEGLDIMEKIREVEAYVNRERQMAFYQAMNRIISTFRTIKKQ